MTPRAVDWGFPSQQPELDSFSIFQGITLAKFGPAAHLKLEFCGFGQQILGWSIMRHAIDGREIKYRLK
jgi:hypothetical protein